MTLAIGPTASALQLIGLFGSAIGFAATFMSRNYCMGSIYVVVGIIAVFTDFIAVWTAPSRAAIAATLVKPLAFFGAGMILISCRPIDLPEPVIPTWLGPTLVLGSSIPSILGAVLQRKAR